jgi:hypothetical protein
MKKLIAAVSTLFIAVALSIVAVAGPASAHTATLVGAPTCNTDGSGTIVWTVTNDYPETANVTASDNAVIPVGTTIDATSGNGSTHKSFTQTIPAPAAGVSVTTTLSFLWSGDNFTQSNTKDTEKIPSTCKVRDASAAIVDTPATCGAAETIALGAIANATWGPLDLSGSHWGAVATATSGHAFASGNGGTLSSNNTVDTFSGNLPLHSALSPNSETCRIAAAAVTTTAPTCQAPETITEGAITKATWAPITYATSGGVTTYTAIATATSGYTFPTGTGVNASHTTKTFTGTVDGELTGHPCEDYIIVAWHMPSWVNSTTPTWSQTYFTSQEESTPDLSALDSKLVESCGVQYQVDIYYNSPTTASLIAGQHLDGPNNPPEDLIPGGWGVAYKLVQGPACATPATPSESDVCTNGGTITIHAAVGVKYYLNGVFVDTSGGDVVFTGLHGTQTVTATALSGYLLTGYPAGGWPYNINTDCTASYKSSGECTASDSGSQEDVTLNLVNPSGTAATFTVTSSDATVSGTGIYNVPANSTSSVVVGSVSDSGGTFSVSINGGTPIDVVIDDFVGCIPVTPSDPTFTALTCTGQTTNLGSVSTDGNDNLTYTLYESDNTTLHTPVSTFPSLPTAPTIGGLAAGTYFVHVAANPGFVLSGAVVFPFKIILASVNCVGTQQTPVVTFVTPTCEPNPETIDTPKSTTALTEVQGVIHVNGNPNMTFTIDDGLGGGPQPITPDVDIVFPDGTYTIAATLTSTAIADGFTIATGAGYTVSPDAHVATFDPIVFTSECGLPTLASWHSGAAATPAVCTLTGGAAGTITVVHGSDITHPTDEDGKVTYTLVNIGNGHTTDLGSSALTVSVAPGSYTVEAVPTDPADGLVGNPNVANEIDYGPLTVAAPAGSCDGNLAFTGGTIGWFGFALAGGMLFLGIAFMLMRRRQSRIAE